MVRRAAYLVALFLLPLAAHADDPPLIGPRTLELFPRGEERCYQAQFDDGWLAAHKGQILERIQLYRLFTPLEAMEAIERPRAEAMAADKAEDATNWVDVVAQLKGAKSPFTQSLVCSDNDDGASVTCGVECDGGSFRGSRKADGSFSVAFEEGNGLSLNQSCGDPDEEGRDHWMTDKEAGRSFTLTPKPPADCAGLDAEARPGFAADPVPLRQRIAQNGWTCLSRRYDKAHLASHPKQKVAVIALALKGPAAVKVDDEGWRSTEIPARLSLKMRDGKTAAKDVVCTADEYQYRCDSAFRLRRKDAGSALLLAGEYGGDGAEAPETLNGLKLGLDDLTFRLDGGQDAPCRAE